MMEADIELQATVGDGKYTVIFEKQGRLYALRYGEPWRDCLGDGMILAMLQKIVGLKTALEAIDKTSHGMRRSDMTEEFWQALLQARAALVAEPARGERGI